MLLSSTALSGKTTETVMNRLEVGKIYARNTIWFLVLKVRKDNYDILILSSQTREPGEILRKVFSNTDGVKLVC